ncbi:MAG TPA: 1,2-phenylacetyl-CoA epoxidase subunit PaaD [Gemmatimonadaceae bacterium]|jgi:ring-1,2-phenylacetyl-CoA epoxidase subunit PaaD|nr:1,2-phenylacetyl-CoA epoxidase subunit PaaD [Gemmatimonadaceae bacterium]
MAATRDDVLALLHEVKDPELPMLDVVELGIVRDVQVADDGEVRINITPTYSGCPALNMIEQDIVTALTDHGMQNVTVHTVYSPAWTTDWLSTEAKEKLRQAGITPPGRVEQETLVMLERAHHTVACPYCGSTATEERSEFGSTACKAIHYCTSCQQPFDRFKTL